MEHPKLLAYCTPKNSGYKLENNTGFFFPRFKSIIIDDSNLAAD